MVFDYKNSAEYLKSVFEKGSVRSGLKTGFSQAAGIKKSFLSQILSGKAQLSLEQAEKANSYLGHSLDESKYFLLLVSQDRAGTHTLKKYFENQMIELSQKRNSIRNRIKVKGELNELQKAHYYSSWLYAAVHVATSIPSLQSRTSLRTYFAQVSPSRLTEAISFLISAGLVKEIKGRLSTGPIDLHISPNSPEIFQHHIAWRMRCIETLQKNDAYQDLHYSGVVSISKSDISVIKEILMKSLADCVGTVKKSKEEELYALNLDFFKVLS